MGQFIDLNGIDLRPQEDIPPEVPYLIFREVCGRGGMATVWRAWHHLMEREVAVKVLDASFADNPADLERFQTEARVLACLQHPGFVRGYGAECVNGRHFYLMDFIGGYTLKALLARKTKISENNAMAVIECVASALGYAWNSFKTVHCDLKPDNIMLDVDSSVKIMDLGLASETMFTEAKRIATRKDSDEIIGTPMYMSPEQIYGDVELDCRTDIYSLGATVYQLVTGHDIFPGMSTDNVVRAHVDEETAAPDPRIFTPELSAPFVRLLSWMLVKDRNCRLQVWDAVSELCATVEAGYAIPVPTSPSSIATNEPVSP